MVAMVEPASPCIAVCELDDEMVCRGCGRTIDEIGAWAGAGAEEKQKIIALAQKRAQTDIANQE